MTLARDVDISMLTADSRQAVAGAFFAALPGVLVDGADFIDDAIQLGAVCVLLTPEALRSRKECNDKEQQRRDEGVVWLTDPVPGRLFAQLAARFYAPQPQTMAAVTGTNGKTSVADFARQIWHTLGEQAASIGTLGIEAPDYQCPGTLTTPDPVNLHKALHDLCERGVNYVAFEASSHGLAQYRLDGVQLSAAAFTNFSRDHLDYHGTEENYYYAKARLFGEVMKPGGVAVLNADCEISQDLADLCWARGHRMITVGRDQGDLRLLTQRPAENGQDITFVYEGQVYDVALPLIGQFQAMNALMAAALVMGCGKSAEDVFRALGVLRPVRGRMELAGRHANGARVYVDYAHTPDALETVLTSLKMHTQGNLAVVFGCGGDRDQGKRPMMGGVAHRLADKVYVTDDNPRTEDPAAIRASILSACPSAEDIADRQQAIDHAVAALAAEDILVVAGKGHETGQIIGADVRDFDDVIAVRHALSAVGRGQVNRSAS
ncbi:MAG: UDP-N-acetylmuramoyl-L-alanyl-D-glutamate--2,6-diaminopimelate ligase [Kordiimonas sp.]|nr:UDP-N-acetylmuramoyl-L-alanyl-D-glutamate--2,6-diaminopimelate ligase [Kordiimonas sp.]